MVRQCSVSCGPPSRMAIDPSGRANTIAEWVGWEVPARLCMTFQNTEQPAASGGAGGRAARIRETTGVSIILVHSLRGGVAGPGGRGGAADRNGGAPGRLLGIVVHNPGEGPVRQPAAQPGEQDGDPRK